MGKYWGNGSVVYNIVILYCLGLNACKHLCYKMMYNHVHCLRVFLKFATYPTLLLHNYTFIFGWLLRILVICGLTMLFT